MIGWEDIYNVVAGVMPLYIALILGYGAIRWWGMFKIEDVNAINKFNCFFIVPFFAFDFASRINPYEMNTKFVLADIISKSIIIVVLVLWANFTNKGNYEWAITCFSLSSLNNTLVVGVPLVGAMYGQMGADLVVQSFVMQSLVWLIALLFMLELHSARNNGYEKSNNTNMNNNEDQGHCSIECQEIEGRPQRKNTVAPPFLKMMKIVSLKLLFNPNCFSCILGVIWALISNRFGVQMPSIIEGSILIFSKAGAGVAMFTIGLFIALQEKFISCGVYVALFALVLRFVVGPLAMAVGAFAMGMKADMLYATVIQAALPQAVITFIFAKEYGLHATVFSTAVSTGTLLSLPILIAYYAILEALP